MIPIEFLLVIAASLLLLGIFASIASDRLGVPALLLFLFLGMLAGSDGLGGIHFDNAFQAQALGVVALAYILFAGGLSTEWASVRPVLGAASILATLGVLMSALLVGAFAWWAFGVPFGVAVLLGAIVSSTDAAAVFSVLRSRAVSLKGNLRPLLELESGSNDPMAVFLTLGLTGILVDPSSSVLGLVPMFLQQMALGAAAGYAAGIGMTRLVNRLDLQYEGLYPVLTLGLVLLTYGATAMAGGNGFLAVYVAGVVMNTRVFVHKTSLVRFHDGLAWLMQISMFLVLGLLVFPHRLLLIVGIGIAISLFLIFVSRPISVFVCLAFSRLGVREKAMVSWVGLRGAAPIVLATFPLVAGLPEAETIFNVVFFVVLTSSVLQGTTIPRMARLLGVDAPLARKRQYPIELVPSERITNDLVEMEIDAESPSVGRQIVELGLPRGALIVLLVRGDEFVVPTGRTTLEAGDMLLILADQEALAEVRELVAVEHTLGATSKPEA
jgi:cell volume regulation protein A